jgi:hypothetical protein
MALVILEDRMDALGVAYTTRILLQDIDSNFAQVQLTGGASYNGSFQNSDLVAGVLSVNHGLNTTFPKPLIRRPDGTYEDALSIMTYTDVNNVTFDFGGSIAAGTWVILIEKEQ